jgi:lipoprotein-anchoring transpeptidase ErfK/SrfK
MRRLLLAGAPWLAAAALAACSSGGGEPTPTATIAPSQTPTPGPPTNTPFPTFTPTPEVRANAAIVVGGALRVSGPNTQSAEIGTLEDKASVVIDRAEQGENWLVGSQNWVSTAPEWTRTWYRLTDGSYLYAAFVFILQPGEASPLTDPAGQEKWIDVNVSTQEARAMIGDTPVFTAPVSTGASQFPSPLGTHRIGYRTSVERMTATQAGYTPRQATYDVERVLFTQYYADGGNALHLNYWRPQSVFGNQATSHGCIGMQLHDAQWFWLFGEENMRVEVHA